MIIRLHEISLIGTRYLTLWNIDGVDQWIEITEDEYRAIGARGFKGFPSRRNAVWLGQSRVEPVYSEALRAGVFLRSTEGIEVRTSTNKRVFFFTNEIREGTSERSRGKYGLYLNRFVEFENGD